MWILPRSTLNSLARTARPVRPAAPSTGATAGTQSSSLPPFSNTDFSLEPSLARVFPTATAGNGGAGAGGANATATTPALQGGAGGKGGAAFITMDHDIFGSAATPYIGFVTITMSVDAAAIGSAGGDSGGAGGAGGRGGLGITVVTGVNGSQDSRGSDGAIGGAGGVGEVANADLTAMTSYATSDLQIQLISNGGKGGQGGFGGSGGNGSLSAGNGADGARAGAGAPAEATFSGATAFNDSAIFVTEKPTGGFGGSGGNGGNGGNLGTVGSPPTGFGANGNGGAGGAGGGASATVSGDTLTAPSVQFTLNADGGQGGKGGLGGNAGTAPGLNGAAGSDGAGSITFTNNVITVGSGIPGDTQLSGSDLLLLNLRVATIGPAGFFLPSTLNGGVGGNLAFSGNTFIGDGASRLVLQLGSTGTAVVDTIANTISIDGSATSNTISGFTKFTLDTNDVFVAGGGNYQVTFAADPDTLVVTPNSGNVTLAGITSTNFLLDFRGFSPSFDAVALAADTNASSGSTVITLSPTSTITLQGYTGGIASGDVIFEPLPTVVTETASVVAGGVKTGTAGTAGTGALAGDSDLSGYSLAISAISGGALGVSTAGKYGHLTLNADGSYSYSADISDAISGAASGSQPIDTFTFTVSDGRGGTINSTLKFTIDNAPPVTTAPANEIASKGTPFAFSGANLISVADFDALSGPGETITVVLTDTTGLLSAFVNGASGGAILTGNGTQQLTISGGLGQVNAALGTLSFLSNSLGPDQIDVATSDGRGGSDDHKIAVTVTPSTNVPFSIIAPSAAVLGVNQPGSVGIKLAESPTTPGETFSISISDANGALSASTLVAGGGGTIVNSGANTLTISGTLDQVNADLTTLTETNTLTAPDLLFMLASNSNGENAPVVLVDVTVNGAPTITTPSDVRAPAGLATPVPLMKVSETGNTAGEVFVVILSDINGLLSATFGGSPVIGSGTNHLTLSGSLDQVNAELASLKITETAVGLDFITGGVGDGFGNASGQFVIPVIGGKTWTSTVAGDPNNWNNAANWTTTGAPVAGQDIFIPAAGPQPIIFDGASGLIGGTLTNNGTVTLASTGTQTTLLVSGSVLLHGTGAVVLSDSPLNSIISAGGAATLENEQTISGAGLINVTVDSNQSLAFHNDFDGTVNATGLNALAIGPPTLFPSGLITNDGLMEASGTGGLILQAVDVTNNGIIQANNGSHVDLSGGAIISGGTLSTNGTGVIRSVVGDNFSDGFAPILDGVSNGVLTNSGTVEIGATDKLVITGTINNSGSINLRGNATQAATLFIEQTARLGGTGALVLSDSPLNSIISVGGAATLENAQTISGAGSIDVTADSNQSLVFHNDFSGIVNATGINALSFGPASLFPVGLVTNDGLMEASGAGGLLLQAVFMTNNGIIQANNGSHVDLSGLTTISGGTLSTNGTGVIRSVVGDTLADGFAPWLDGASNGVLTNLGTVEIGATDKLVVTGTINNSGTINLRGNATQAATLFIEQTATLGGTGALVLSDSPLNSIVSFGGAATLENAQTISGAGLIKVTGEFTPSLAFHNDFNGTVNATGVNALVFGIPSFFPSGQITNDGLMEASGTGGLMLQAVDVTNNGIIRANNGSHVDLCASLVISGGTLSTNGTGVIRSVVGDNFSDAFAPILDGVSNGVLTNSGTVEIGATDKLVITGTINNSGTFRLFGSATQAATLFVEQAATLQGTGSVVLSDSPLNSIISAGGAVTLENAQTISGAGSIDVDTDPNHSMVFHNDFNGIVNATGVNALVMTVGQGFLGGLVTNDGLMEGTGVGGLSLAGVFVTNTGTVAANSGSHVDLGNETTISGGTLSTTGTGVIRTVGNDINSAFGPRLDGSIDPLVNAGTVEIDSNTSLAITGTINNNGTVKLAGGSAQPATLLVEFSATLRGNGSVVLSDSSSNIITGRNSDVSNLDNQQMISGAGFIDVSSDVGRFLSLHNDTTGVIDATGFNALVISGQPSIYGPALVTNDGLMEAAGAGGLVFDYVAVTNNSGLIEASSGSHVDFVNAQLSGAGGLLFIDPNASVTFSNASVATGQIIQFLKGANETLVLDDATINGTTIGAHISGFAIGDEIDLAQLKVTSATIDGSARVHLFSGTTEIGSLQLDSSNLGERFVVTGDGGAGTWLTIGVSTPPQVTESLANDTGTKPNDAITNDPSLAGTGDAFAVVSFSEGGVNLGTTVADATGAWHFTPTNVSQGSHTVIASETNAAGTGHASLAFIYNSVAPSVAITTPDALVANPQLSLSGTGEAGTQVQLFDNNSSTGGLVTVDATGHWSEQITLVGTGTHFITASDTDLAGNLGSSAVSTFALDNQIVAPNNQLNVAGTTGADHITISQGNILVSAGTGNDTITLTPDGNFQFHFLNGGPGNDTLDLSQIAGNVTANLAQDTLIGSQVGFSVLNSIENIIAGSGNERLIGSSGANLLQAGAGTDTITGHGGGDTFVFKPGFGKAVVTDFHVATTNANPHDLIELDHSLFPQFATVQALLASTEVTQSGSSVVIAADPAHTIELQHTSLRTLIAHANDFVFV